MRLVLVLGLLAAAGTVWGQGSRYADPSTTSVANAGDRIRAGHSHLGDAFDAGPRTRPVVMEGIGHTHFPISTKNPEVQRWFDQGNTLLHSFWDFEAERSFRWALKLEPDNPMIYWGLARATGGERSKEFIRKAAALKGKATERERLYIESLEALNETNTLRDRGDRTGQNGEEYRKILESITVKYPDDVEAKALLAYAYMGDARQGAERLIREILAVEPNHPGAHHYRIHNWNYHEPEMALDSCVRYGEIAKGSGHALHMPGHVYATVGMWQEAAISMDSATRTEKRLMQERLQFPYNHWNYGHNRNYLNYIQEQLGMPEAAIAGAKQLLAAPMPNAKVQGFGQRTSLYGQGSASLLRSLVKYQRWAELLQPSTFRWPEQPYYQALKAYAESRGYLGLGHFDEADQARLRLEGMKASLAKDEWFKTIYETMNVELRARLLLARGETLRGLAELTKAAEMQYAEQSTDNDPPFYPEALYLSVGREYLKAKSPGLAVEAFEKSLKLVRNDIFALSGLVESYHAIGDDAKAKRSMEQLLFTASDADADLPFIGSAKATGVTAVAKDYSPRAERNYKKFRLDEFGPEQWEPFAAPELRVSDPDGKPVTLSEYRGKNVILVFYLGRECVHCITQLQELSAKQGDWDKTDTVILAVSSNTVATNKDASKDRRLAAVRLLSDKDHEAYRHFQSYDDFEEMEVHSTFLIDKLGRVYWGSIGGDPFTDYAFIERNLEKMNRMTSAAANASSAR